MHRVEIKLDALKYMITKGANPNCYNDRAFREACYYENEEVAKYLLEVYNVDVNIDHGFALISALSYNRYNFIKLILSTNFDIDNFNIDNFALNYGGRNCDLDYKSIRILVDLATLKRGSELLVRTSRR